MGREGKGGKGGEDRGGEERRRDGNGGHPPNILLHPQFQFSRNMPGNSIRQYYRNAYNNNNAILYRNSTRSGAKFAIDARKIHMQIQT